MTDHVHGKVIVVTGAASGFGRLVSLKTAALGALLVCGDVDAAELGVTVEQISAAGGDAVAVPTDVTDLAQVQNLARQAVTRFGRIDVLVNNAGIMPLAFYADHVDAVDAWNRCIDVNFRGVLNGIVAVYDQMIRQGRGHVHKDKKTRM